MTEGNSLISPERVQEIIKDYEVFMQFTHQRVTNILSAMAVSGTVDDGRLMVFVCNDAVMGREEGCVAMAYDGRGIPPWRASSFASGREAP